MNKKITIIGGGSGGGSFAARIRRFDNDAEIKIFERSPYVSYSNCGQPYLISGEKPDFESIIVYSKKDWKEQYNVDAFTRHEVISVNPKNKTITVKNLETGEEFDESYDVLMIAPGSPAIKPNIPGIENAKNIHSLKTPDQLEQIMKGLNGVKKAAVIGGGFIGVELAENCKKIGLDVTLVDSATQLMQKSVDEDFSVFINKALVDNGINLKLGTSLNKIENDGKLLKLSDGTDLETDIIFMVVGVKPELEMYKASGIEIGEATNGIKVDLHSRTNIKDIYAVGDIAETVDWMGNPSRIQLAIIAQRMSTIAANDVYGVDDKFMGVQNSMAVSIFGTSVASTGYSEKELKERGMEYDKVIGIEQHAILHGENVYLKVLYDKDGQILGAQSAGPYSAEKRVNYAAMAQMHKIPVDQLLHFQVAYNPVTDTQRDPINLVARIARQQMNGVTDNATVLEMQKYVDEGYTLLDVRTPEEYKAGHVAGAKLFPLQELTEKMDTLDKDGKYIIYCRRGARAYNFQMRMKNAGFKNVINILGAYDHINVYENYKYDSLRKGENK